MGIRVRTRTKLVLTQSAKQDEAILTIGAGVLSFPVREAERQEERFDIGGWEVWLDVYGMDGWTAVGGFNTLCPAVLADGGHRQLGGGGPSKNWRAS